MSIPSGNKIVHHDIIQYVVQCIVELWTKHCPNRNQGEGYAVTGKDYFNCHCTTPKSNVQLQKRDNGVISNNLKLIESNTQRIWLFQYMIEH